MAFASSASRSAAGDAVFTSYDLGSSVGFRLVTVRGKSVVELENVAFDSERFCYQRTSSLLDSPRSESPDYTPDLSEYVALAAASLRSRSPDYSPATPEYSPQTPSSQRSGSPDYSPATPNYTPLAPPNTPATANYTPGTPPSGCCLSDYLHDFDRYCYSPSMGYSPRAASPEYTPASPSGRCSPGYPAMLSDDLYGFCYTPPSAGYSSPEYTPITDTEYTPRSPSGRCSPEYMPSLPEYTPATPEYTPLAPLSPLRRASSPDYTPSSPSVSDAVSRTSPASNRRHHPYQRSRTSCCHHRRSSSRNGY